MDILEFLILDRIFNGRDSDGNDCDNGGCLRLVCIVIFVIIGLALLSNLLTTCVSSGAANKDIPKEDSKMVENKTKKRPSTSKNTYTVQQNSSTVQQKKSLSGQQKKLASGQQSSAKLTTDVNQVAAAKRAEHVSNQLQKSSAVPVASSVTVATKSASATMVSDTTVSLAPVKSAGGQKLTSQKDTRRYIEVFTATGEIRMYVGMPKDSVKMLMGNPHSTRAYDLPYSGLQETWEYMGRNKYMSEFTFEFVDGKLKSMRQYREL